MKQKGICMKRIIYIVTACAFLSVSTAKAQQVLTLKECLEEGPVSYTHLTLPTTPYV